MSRPLLLGILFACAFLPDRTCAAKDDVNPPAPAETPPGEAAPPPPAGFSRIPAGVVHPGTTPKDIKERAQDVEMARFFQYEQWGEVPEVALDAFYLARYETTNAQWKQYLDSRFLVTVKTSGQDSLKSLARQYVHFRDEPQELEWEAIFLLNHDPIVAKLKEAKLWSEKLEQNPTEIGDVVLPKDLPLRFYRHRTPRHWIAWNPLPQIRVGREFVDLEKPPAEAFRRPEGEAFAKLRYADFAACPVRDVSLDEALAFLEWAGCGLPSEYEYERAARADRPNTEQFPFPGKWDHSKEIRLFAWVNNEACALGPMPVDDESVGKGDGAFGQRHLLGNVWEMTRTVYDAHPDVKPKLKPDLGTFNYCFVVKGGAWGDARRVLQISTRTPSVGADYNLQYNHRADSVGFRMRRDPAPGRDLLWHSMMRFVYHSGRGLWEDDFLPPAFAFRRAAATDTAKFAESASPYIHAKERAIGVGVLPLWMTTLTKSDFEGAGEKRHVLGLLRSDLPIRAGVKLSDQEAAELEAMRKAFEAFKRNPPKKQKGKPDPVPPPEPPPVSEHEKLGAKFGGVWQERTLAPGEWYLACQHGVLCLLNKAKIVVAILPHEPKEAVRYERLPAKSDASGAVEIDEAKDRMTLAFTVEENAGSKLQTPPEQRDGDQWALCETPTVNGWKDRKQSANAWRIRLALDFEKDALKNKSWNK